MKHFSNVILLVFIFCLSCKKQNCETTLPAITYKAFIQYPDSGKLVIAFTDCDGDVGLRLQDTAAPYDYNLFLTYQEYKNGKWNTPVLNPPFYYRIPELTLPGPKKNLEGEIEVTISKPAYFPDGQADTIRFDVVLKDRALNESNKITTPAFVKPS
jgi:hypothetical protein